MIKLPNLDAGLIAGAKNRYSSKVTYGIDTANPHKSATFITDPIFSVTSIAVSTSNPPGRGFAKKLKIGLMKANASVEKRTMARIDRKICFRIDNKCGIIELGCLTTVPKASPRGLLVVWDVSVKNVLTLRKGISITRTT